jgi:hypothetical protein
LVSSYIHSYPEREREMIKVNPLEQCSSTSFFFFSVVKEVFYQESERETPSGRKECATTTTRDIHTVRRLVMPYRV